MKYDVSVLREALKTLKRVAAEKTLNEETNCVLIKDGKAWATNGVITVSIGLGTSTEEAVLLPPKATDIIMSLCDAYADIGVKDNTVTIKSARGKYKFAMGDVNAFIMPDRTNSEVTVTMTAEAVKGAIGSVAYAVDKKSSRKEMTGIYFNSNGHELEVVGCDGCRLAVSKAPCDKAFSIIVPMDAAKLIMALKAEDENDTIDITVSGRNALFACGDTEIYTLLYGGQYLNYGKIMAANKTSHWLNVDCEELKGSLQRAAACWDNIFKVPLEITLAEKRLSLKMNTSTITFDETIEADCDIDMRIGVNPKLLLEALNNIKGEARIEWSGALNPIFISDDSTTALVLPVRLKD